MALAATLTLALPALSARAVVTVGAGRAGRTVPPGFLGLSLEYSGVTAYAGSDPDELNPILLQLIRNLAPGQRPVLRIGGDTTDWTWWPVPGAPTPAGIRITLSQKWLAVAHALTQALDARLILGINLEADSGTLAATEAQALLAGLGSGSVQALELGNEPDYYSTFPYYTTPSGRNVLGRSQTGWTYSAFSRDFTAIARSLPAVALAGPSIGSRQWSTNLGPFLRAHPRVAIATLHRYPLQRCEATTHLTVAQLLSIASAKGLADSVAGYVGISHARGIPLRIDEMNSISCGGQPGLSNSYATALWALDALYEMVRVGVDGVNIHSSQTTINTLFRFTHSSAGWTGSVSPLYYGLMMFAQAAPARARLLAVSGPIPSAARVWATRASDGTVRTVVINDGSRPETITLHLPSSGRVVLERLLAPSVTARAGITLGGQTFGPETTTGLLAGTPAAPTLTPRHGVYSVTMPPASAAILTPTRQ